MKKIKCTYIANSSNGLIAPAIQFESVAAAKRYAKDDFHFTYRIIAEDGKIYKGYCG